MIKEIKKYIRQILIESVDYPYIYHGTSASAARSIKEQGFDISLSGKKTNRDNPGISFTASEEIAFEHAEWASKEFGELPAMVVVTTRNLNIMNGTEFQELWNEKGYEKAISSAKNLGYDGVEYFDYETGDGIEEMEVLLFYPDKINIFRAYEL